jgi:hypothetical protein
LIEKNYLKTKKNKIVITFLDKEREEIESKRLKLSESGRKGGLSRAKASLKQGSSIKEVDKDKEYNIAERKQKFASNLASFVDIYGKQMIRDFYDYWTEHGERDKKMRYEKETSFNLDARLNRWNKNVQERNKPKFNAPTTIID